MVKKQLKCMGGVRVEQMKQQVSKVKEQEKHAELLQSNRA